MTKQPMSTVSTLNPDRWGFIALWFKYANPEQSAVDVINDNYVRPFKHFEGFKDNKNDGLSYKGDPTMYPIDSFKWNDELVMLYDYSWVRIVSPDGSFVIDRLD